MSNTPDTLAAELTCIETRGKWDAQTCHQAAAELRRLAAEVEALRAALLAVKARTECTSYQMGRDIAAIVRKPLGLDGPA